MSVCEKHFCRIYRSIYALILILVRATMPQAATEVAAACMRTLVLAIRVRNANLTCARFCVMPLSLWEVLIVL